MSGNFSFFGYFSEKIKNDTGKRKKGQQIFCREKIDKGNFI